MRADSGHEHRSLANSRRPHGCTAVAWLGYQPYRENHASAAVTAASTPRCPRWKAARHSRIRAILLLQDLPTLLVRRTSAHCFRPIATRPYSRLTGEFTPWTGFGHARNCCHSNRCRQVPADAVEHGYGDRVVRPTREMDWHHRGGQRTPAFLHFLSGLHGTHVPRTSRHSRHAARRKARRGAYTCWREAPINMVKFRTKPTGRVFLAVDGRYVIQSFLKKVERCPALLVLCSTRFSRCAQR